MAALSRVVRRPRTRAVAVRVAWALAAAAQLALPALLGAQSSEASRRPESPTSQQSRDLVVLVHGMGRSAFSMRPLEDALEAAGYEVVRFGYSSLCCAIPELGERLRAAVVEQAGNGRAVHFVGHSLGNILVRWTLTRDTVPFSVGRVVMLAPPNQGAAAADRFAGVAGWLLRPLSGLTTDSLATVRTLPEVQGVEIGIIAARDDHTVRFTETHLAEESAHIVVDGGHTFIMRRQDVHARTIEFLRTGRFALTGPLTTPLTGPLTTPRAVDP